MEPTPSATELLDSAALCIQMILVVLGSAAGIFGAMKARKEGAPGVGPMLVAGGFGILVAMGLWTILTGVAPGAMWEWSDFRRILNLLGILLELGGMAALLVGFALLTAPPKPEGGQP